MASEIRVNTINNSSGLGTITISDTGAVFAGVTTITNLQVNGTTTGVVMTGVTTVSTGSTSAPSITPSGDSNTGIFFPSADTIAFAEGGSEAARIDSSGRLLVGTSSAYVAYGASSDNKFQIAGTSYSNAAMSAFVFGATPYGGYLNLGLSRNSTVGSHTVVQSGDGLGGITFNGSDGTTFKAAADIHAYVDGTPGTNDMPGRLVFSTTADGSASPTERMRLDSSGRLGLGTSSPGATLDVSGSIRTKGSTNPYLALNDGTNESYVEVASSNMRLSAGGANSLVFNTNSAERARIDSSGRLLVGTSSARSGFFNGAGGTESRLLVENTTGINAFCSVNSSAGAGGNYVVLAKNRSGTLGGNTVPNSGDEIGGITFQAADGTDFVEAARIQAFVDGTPALTTCRAD